MAYVIPTLMGAAAYLITRRIIQHFVKPEKMGTCVFKTADFRVHRDCETGVLYFTTSFPHLCLSEIDEEEAEIHCDADHQPEENFLRNLSRAVYTDDGKVPCAYIMEYWGKDIVWLDAKGKYHTLSGEDYFQPNKLSDLLVEDAQQEGTTRCSSGVVGKQTEVGGYSEANEGTEGEVCGESNVSS